MNTPTFAFIACLVSPIILVALYIYRNDRALTRMPHEAAALSPTRWTDIDIDLAMGLEKNSPMSVKDSLPPKTGCRYIVTGGAGFLGGHLIQHLLLRGEDPHNIRILDIGPPRRRDLNTGSAKDIQFIQVDITDAAAVLDAFRSPWPQKASSGEIVVLHTAAVIRFFERHPAFLPLSQDVIVKGTQNVINASLSAGVAILIVTSTMSVSLKSQRFLLWPWETKPKRFVQIFTDDENLIPKQHYDFAGNYCVAKAQAEKCVKAADKSPTGSGLLRTGVIRPAMIYGPGSDVFEYNFRSGGSAEFLSPYIQSGIYVENCALAHLFYEQRLQELRKGGGNPDIGGQSFTVADPGAPMKWSDVYYSFQKMSNGRVKHQPISITFLLILSHFIETYCIMRHFARDRLGFFGKLFPPITGQILNIQPAMFNISLTHGIVDDSRARLPAERGGLGYVGTWTTMEGVAKCWQEYDTNGPLTPGNINAAFGVTRNG